MIRRVFPVALLALAGCSAGTSEAVNANTVETADKPMQATAVLSCTINGTAIAVSACLIGSGQTMGGRLKVSSAGTTKQYTDYDLVRENGRTLELSLTVPFEITAQANSDSGYVLRMEVKEGEKTVFQDDTTEFGVIVADSASLGT